MVTFREAAAPIEPPIVVEHREQLIFLLREAAELEHAIMCEYLFAAFTLKRTADEGLTAAQVDAVDRWRDTVSLVARQEMLHLALVQNLLASVGAAPYFSRPDLPTQAHHFPPGVRIALVPFNESALRHFLYLERPEGVAFDEATAAALQRARPILDEHDIVPRAQDFATVGHLYRAIDIGFGWLTAKLGEAKLFIGPPTAQATSESFRWPELVPVVDLASAHAAIDTIVEQGEGTTGDWRTAHFGKFLAVFEEYIALRDADPTFEAARPVVAGTVRPRPGDDVPIISDATTAQVADLFNVANEVVLLTLARYFAHTDETPPQLKTLANVAVGLMVGAIRPLGELLTSLPFGPSHPGMTAGPTFELFYRTGYLLPHREAAWIVLEERLRLAADFARRITGTPAASCAKVARVFDGYADRFATAGRSS